ncbi:MAG: MATE family efflux transporter, partial [Symbiobacteriaceae bacterium]|nr:MATE family efflux transporter [Symbiobacteriaceae bacterium]
VYFFIARLGYGVEGAACATVISQVLMTVFIMIYTRSRHASLRFQLSAGIFDSATLASSLKLSLPTAAQAAVRSLGNMMLQQVMNSFGSQTVAAITTAYRIDSIGLLPVSGLGAAISTFAAQNKGAAKENRANEGLIICIKLACGVALGITLVVTLAGNALLSLFGMAAETVAIGQGVLLRLAVFYPLYGLLSSLSGYLQGMGDVRFVAYATIGALGVRIGFSYLLAPLFGNMVVAYAEAFSWIFQAGICYLRLRQFKAQQA